MSTSILKLNIYEYNTRIEEGCHKVTIRRLDVFFFEDGISEQK